VEDRIYAFNWLQQWLVGLLHKTIQHLPPLIIMGNGLFPPPPQKRQTSPTVTVILKAFLLVFYHSATKLLPMIRQRTTEMMSRKRGFA